MALELRSVLRCDLCPNQVAWPSSLSRTAARLAAKQKFGWRTDKLNRDVCSAHPRLNQRKTEEN